MHTFMMNLLPVSVPALERYTPSVLFTLGIKASSTSSSRASSNTNMNSRNKDRPPSTRERWRSAQDEFWHPARETVPPQNYTPGQSRRKASWSCLPPIDLTYTHVLDRSDSDVETCSRFLSRTRFHNTSRAVLPTHSPHLPRNMGREMGLRVRHFPCIDSLRPICIEARSAIGTM